MTSARWLLRIARPEAWRLLAAAALGSLALSCSIGLMATSGWLISRAAQQPPVLYLTVAIVAVRAFGIGRGVIRYAERLVGHDAAFRVLARTRVQAWLDLDRAAPAGLGKLRSGDVLASLVGDVEAVQDLLVRAVLPIAIALITGTATVVMLGALLPAAGLVLLAGLLVAGLAAPAGSLLVAGRAERRLAPAKAALTDPVHELLTGSADLIAYGAAPAALARIAGRDRMLTSLSRKSAAGAGLGVAIGGAALAFTVVGELLVGIQAVREGQLSGVLLAVLALTPLAAFELTTTLPAAAQHLVRGLRAVDRLRALEDLPHPSVAWGNKAVSGHTLTILGADARWPGSAHPTLRDVTLRLAPGRRIAVVGASGAGKSTLVAALAGFLATERGSVTYGGVPLGELDEDSFRRQVVVCAQDDHLFDTTIRNNLLVGKPDATTGELMNALRQARLEAWVSRQPSGLDTTVGERAVQLSGGERQRLALARALLADPAILLLDEPTAHLDEPTAAELTRDILTATRGRATLLVTHRLDGLEDLDEVIVLGHGEVSRRGHPADILPSARTRSPARS
ncbi:thiol reductant ABC exporter subunit CydC [Kribbella antibiotica]|uniref:Thiol reductant ABC exporter subunit CydC n=1 Tax=Kribbella antibiotica TaxID=190195 RepID=A0A4R4ZP20_9ACTN|nr:thiol reductant ABC exporter subunit CydC [Kribbella antibiotica]TDD60651.1 thiol reductant ABC exporter subunit CydC [Kribbella antibiotica]